MKSNFFSDNDNEGSIYLFGSIILILILTLFMILGCTNKISKPNHQYLVEVTYIDKHKDTLSFKQDTIPYMVEYDKGKYGMKTSATIMADIINIKILRKDNLDYYKLKILYDNGKKDTIETYLKYMPLLECKMENKDGLILHLDNKAINHVIDFTEID